MKHDFIDLVDGKKLQSLMQNFHRLTKIPTSIIDIKGKLLYTEDGQILGAGWQRICTDFHRVHPETEKKCIECDTVLSRQLQEGKRYSCYKCLNGLVDMAMPIHVDGEHVANLFTGQYLNEAPDLDYFRRQAAQYGFDEKDYLDALSEVPIFAKEYIEQGIAVLVEFAEIISEMGLTHKGLIETNKQLQRSRASLNESNQFNRQIIDSARDGIIVYGLDLSYQVWNPRMQEISGLAADMVLGRRASEVFPFLKDAGVIERLERNLKGDTGGAVDFLCHYPQSGKSVWVSETSAPLKNYQGEIIGVISVVRDITERKKAEQALKKSEERARRLFESVSVGIILQSADGTITQTNDIAQQIFNIPASEIQGKTSQDPQWHMVDEKGNSISGEDHPSMITLRTGKPLRNVLRGLFSKDPNRMKWLLINTEPITDDLTGEVTDVLISFSDITEHKKAQESLMESEQRYRSYIENAPQGLFVADRTGQYLVANQAACDMTGYAEEELLTLSIPDLLHEDSREAGRKHFQRVVDTGKSSGELKFLKKDGAACSMLVNAIALSEDVFMAFCVDITDKMEAYEIKEKYTKLYEAVIKQAPFAAHIIEGSADHMRVVIENQESVRTMGEKLESGPHFDGNRKDSISCRFYTIDGEKEVPLWEMPGVRALNGETVIKEEFLFRHEDGQELFVEVSASPVLGGRQEILAAVVTFHDITERKKAEEALKNSEAFLNSVVEQNPFPIWISDSRGTLMRSNNALKKILNVTDEQIVGKYNVLADPVVERAGLLNRFLTVYNQGATVDFEIDWHAEKMPDVDWVDVSPVSIEGALFPIHDRTGKLTNAVMTYKDISDRKRKEEAERKMYEQDKMAAIGRVAGKMAHDMNNVLGVTLSLSDLILYTEELPPALKADIEAIRESAERGAEITKNLLFFAKDQETKYTQFDLNEKIVNVLKALQKQLSGITVSTSFGASLHGVIADLGLMENAVLNLIHNSIHAMSKTENPLLSIHTEKKNDWIFIEISDNGCGIPEEHLDKVFDVSFTMKGSMDRTGAYRRDIKGSGYGLANVKRAIDKHGGAISLQSRAGQGATFTIGLPVIDAEIKPEEIKKIMVGASRKGKRILVVEDEHHFGNILYKLLRQYDHKVHRAGNAQEALDLLADNEFDAVSLDFILPDKNGMEVYLKIRETNKQIPIVFVSGNFEFMQSMIDLKKKDPKVDHLAKPFNNVDYVNMIHKWLG